MRSFIDFIEDRDINQISEEVLHHLAYQSNFVNIYDVLEEIFVAQYGEKNKIHIVEAFENQPSAGAQLGRGALGLGKAALGGLGAGLGGLAGGIAGGIGGALGGAYRGMFGGKSEPETKGGVATGAAPGMRMAKAGMEQAKKSWQKLGMQEMIGKYKIAAKALSDYQMALKNMPNIEGLRKQIIDLKNQLVYVTSNIEKSLKKQGLLD